MNRLFSILLLLCTLASLNVKAQSDSHNYIVKSSMLDEQGQISVVMVNTTMDWDALMKRITPCRKSIKHISFEI